jgi:hypothetical protein
MIKTIAKDKGEHVSDFPKLMKSTSSGNIVLMNSSNGTCGAGVVVVYKGGAIDVGHYSNMWAIGMFEDYDGSVTLQNA